MTTDTTVRMPARCSPLSPEELARARTLLTNRQSEILRSCQALSHVALRQSGDAGGDDATVTEDPGDAASETSEQDLSLNFLGRVQAELSEIMQAIDRIDRSSYGVCDGCGNAIPAARLEAIPSASTCVECKSKSEQPPGIAQP